MIPGGIELTRNTSVGTVVEDNGQKSAAYGGKHLLVRIYSILDRHMYTRVVLHVRHSETPLIADFRVQ